MEKPLVSIIMSNYNGERLIRKTIESVLHQTYDNFEFIIIDDGSTDTSKDIINLFSDKRIKKYFFESNENMCYAFNYGLSHGNGKYFARIDSDDTWEPEKLEKQVTYLESNMNCAACFTLVTVIDENDRQLTAEDTDRVVLFKTGNRNRLEWLNHFFYKGSCLCHPSVMFRKSIIEKVGGYNYSLRQIQDYELWLRIAKTADIHVIQEPLINYRWFCDGSNASSPSAGVNNRSDYEFGYVIAHFFDNMSDEDFVGAFGQDFVHKDAMKNQELEFEKIFLLLKPTFCGNYHRDRVMDMLVNMLQNTEKRKILRKKYNFTQKDFYELSSEPIYFGSHANVEHVAEQVSYDENKYAFRFWLHEHLPSPIWKIGAGMYHIISRGK